MAVLRIFILTGGLVGSIAQAQHSEIVRLKGFAEHQTSDRKFDQERLRGEKEFNEEQEAWDRQQRQDRIRFKQDQAKKKAKDDGQTYREDVRERQVWNEDYEVSRKAYAKEIKKFDRKKYPDLVSEDTELGLDIERPRYSLKSRGLYGAPTKFGKLGHGGSLSGGSAVSNSGGFGTGSNTGSQPAPSFPPPPPFDDFGDGGFVPSGEGFSDDIPPPPPPPPMPFDMTNGEPGEGGFIPPPPPPSFDEGSGAF